MNIKILGSGCKNCKILYENTVKAVNELNIEAEIEKIEDFREVMKYGVISTPALVVDEEVKSSGKILSLDEIRKILGE